MEKKIAELFEAEFNEKPSFTLRAPGRVNLIGEHIDYSGYGVLPMAVEQSVFCAVKVTGDKIVLHNTEKKYGDVEDANYSVFDKTEFDQDPKAPQWQKYFLCGVRGMMERLAPSETEKPTKSKGMKVMVYGNIPPSSGLSSSSAMVCAAALCTLRANADADFDKISRSEIAEMCAKCERYIGTEGGGMDQAICLLAQAGEAKLIEFNPLRTKSVLLPDGATFVIANCCVDMNKAATPRYNERVVECRIAAQIMAQKLGFDWKEIRTLGLLQTRLGKQLNDMVQVVDELLPEAIYSRDAVCKLLNVTSDQLVSTSLSQNTTKMQEFKLNQRAKHVYSEANRVFEFDTVCRSAQTGDQALVLLGELMDESHVSCRDLYECSCEELDQLQNAAKKAGALGSRLTGAGWGGCTVSLVKTSEAKKFVEKLRASFYLTVNQATHPFEKSVFITAPSGGAEISLLH